MTCVGLKVASIMLHWLFLSRPGLFFQRALFNAPHKPQPFSALWSRRALLLSFDHRNLFRPLRRAPPPFSLPLALTFPFTFRRAEPMDTDKALFYFGLASLESGTKRGLCPRSGRSNRAAFEASTALSEGFLHPSASVKNPAF